MPKYYINQEIIWIHICIETDIAYCHAMTIFNDTASLQSPRTINSRVYCFGSLLWFLTSVMLQETCMSNAKLLVDFLCIYVYIYITCSPKYQQISTAFRYGFGWSYHNILKIRQTYSQHITSAAKFLPWSSHGVACPWSRIQGNSSAVVKQTMGRCGFWNHQTNMSTCFNVFQRVSTCFNVFQRVSTCFNVFQRVSTCFNVFQRVSTCFNVFQRVSVCT